MENTIKVTYCKDCVYFKPYDYTEDVVGKCTYPGRPTFDSFMYDHCSRGLTNGDKELIESIADRFVNLPRGTER